MVADSVMVAENSGSGVAAANVDQKFSNKNIKISNLNQINLDSQKNPQQNPQQEASPPSEETEPHVLQAPTKNMLSDVVLPHVPSEREKMLSGKLYDATDPELVAHRYRARILLSKINNFPVCDPHEANAVMGVSSEGFANGMASATVLRDALLKAHDTMVKERGEIVKKLIPNSGKNLYIEPPFQCDYANIHCGDNCYFNFNCIVLDICKIKIGNRFLAAPNVQLYAASHPVDAKVRASGLEDGKEIVIGDDCWLGGGAIVRPGVTIGDRVVVAAGAVVVKDVPNDCVVGGNPAKIIKRFTDGEWQRVKKSGMTEGAEMIN